ncbi:hypothetical protein EYF80_006450 [Liparis tanakae]|uniref:Uncharacterized protein n=1 Tax=Liparis tanakae TaxID=230148 RepID=A0A4Z2IZN9_9TELE|nr:hypothetical protein EYF80_006450 [Liparis tanakae]
MEEESAVSSKYSVELSLSNPRSGTSSRVSLAKSSGPEPPCPMMVPGMCIVVMVVVVIRVVVVSSSMGSEDMVFLDPF